MKKAVPIASIAAVLFGFFIMGFCDLVGTSVSYAKDSFGWSSTQASQIPFMVFIWFLIVSVPTSMIMDKIGRKKTVLVSMFFTFVGMILPLLKFDATLCLVAFAFLGIGNTILQVSLNPLLTNVISGDRLTSSLTVGQFIKAISSFVGPFVALLCATYFNNWVLMFPIFAAITLISSAWLYFTQIEEAQEKKANTTLMQVFGLLSDRKILLFFFGILCVVGLDVGMNTITPQLLIERLHMPPQTASLGSSWYFAARTIGTVVGAILLVKMPEKKYFQLNMLICLAAVVGLVFASSYVSIITLVCIIAFTASSVFAVIYSMAMKTQPTKANEISGLMITGVAGGALFPTIMGSLSDFMHSQVGGVIVIAACTLYLLFCSYVKVREV